MTQKTGEKKTRVLQMQQTPPEWFQDDVDPARLTNISGLYYLAPETSRRRDVLRPRARGGPQESLERDLGFRGAWDSGAPLAHPGRACAPPGRAFTSANIHRRHMTKGQRANGIPC
jgi:hypothetical protein